MRMGKNPLPALQNWLAFCGAEGAGWPAHNFFYWVAAHRNRALYLGCPCCGTVSEDEAMLLAITFPDLPKDGRIPPMALGALVHAQAIPQGARLAETLRAVLATSKLSADGAAARWPLRGRCHSFAVS
jgi:hypothetical protein